MPDLHGYPGNNLLNHTAPAHSQLPSFPVSILQNREGSPTKSIYGTSPTGSSSVGVGRRSPIHDMQMDSIAEDLTEDSTTPTEINAPVNIAMVVSDHAHRVEGFRRASLSEQNSGLMMPQAQQSSSRPTTPSALQAGDGGDNRRRRSGAISPALQEQIQASLQDQPPTEHSTLRDVLQNGRNHYQPVVSNSSLITSKCSPMSQGLMSMLQTPLANPASIQDPHIRENGQVIHMTNHTQAQNLMGGVGVPVHPGYLYASALNQYNSQLSGTATAFHTVLPGHHPLLQPTSPYQQVATHPHHPASNVQDVLSHVSSVLNHCGIQYQHSNGVFAVNHQGVQLHILVCHLASQQNAIQLQYVAGDASQYQTLCSHLYSRLTATTLAAQ